MVKSRYTLLLDNVSSATPKKDIIYECEKIAGPVLAATTDTKARQALVEFKRSDDAEYAYRKLHGFKMDGRSWSVDWATPSDFKFFNWRWTEGDIEPERGRGGYGGGGIMSQGGNSHYSSKTRHARAHSRSRSPSITGYDDARY